MACAGCGNSDFKLFISLSHADIIPIYHNNKGGAEIVKLFMKEVGLVSY